MLAPCHLSLSAKPPTNSRWVLTALPVIDGCAHEVIHRQELTHIRGAAASRLHPG